MACGADVRMYCCHVESDFIRPLHLRRLQWTMHKALYATNMRQKCGVGLRPGMCTPKRSSPLKPVMVPVSAISSGLAFRFRHVHSTGRHRGAGGAGTHRSQDTHGPHAGAQGHTDHTDEPHKAYRFVCPCVPCVCDLETRPHSTAVCVPAPPGVLPVHSRMSVSQILELVRSVRLSAPRSAQGV